jgi:hypothetical protein
MKPNYKLIGYSCVALLLIFVAFQIKPNVTFFNGGASIYGGQDKCFGWRAQLRWADYWFMLDDPSAKWQHKYRWPEIQVSTKDRLRIFTFPFHYESYDWQNLTFVQVSDSISADSRPSYPYVTKTNYLGYGWWSNLVTKQ